MDLGLRGKKALITAASSGLGLATARELAADGAHVVICGRSRDRLDEALKQLRDELGDGISIAGHVADVTKQEDVVGLVDFAVDTLEGLDILVTNAGGPPGGTFESIQLEDWRRGLDLTLMSAVYLIKMGLPHLKNSDSASVLTITSMSVKQPINNLHLSNVIRPAVIGLTKSLAQELGPNGIRVNSILPGWTMTERMAYILNHRAEANQSSVKDETEKVTKTIPLGRMADPAEFGKVAAFLVSPAASYVSGIMMLVDGGWYDGLM